VQPAIDKNEGVQLISLDRTKTLSVEHNLLQVEGIGEAVHDSAAILVRSDEPIISRSDLMPMLPSRIGVIRGAEIGWLGFPGDFAPALCFFHGYVSAYSPDPPLYLVDGIVMPGVSGGPAFDKRAQLVGVVSSYVGSTDKRFPGVSGMVPINLIRRFVDERLQGRLMKLEE
jgi:hypothetical protein